MKKSYLGYFQNQATNHNYFQGNFSFKPLKAKYEAKIYYYCYHISFIVGFTFWLGDHFLCEYVQPYQLHAWWHIFASFSILSNLIFILASWLLQFIITWYRAIL